MPCPLHRDFMGAELRKFKVGWFRLKVFPEEPPDPFLFLKDYSETPKMECVPILGSLYDHTVVHFFPSAGLRPIESKEDHCSGGQPVSEQI